jgi:hypothetical protein
VEGNKILRRVNAILMPLETKRDLRLALSAKANNLIQVLIRLRFHSIGNLRHDHSVPLLQDGVRLNLVHKAAFAFKSFTHWTSHNRLFSLILCRRQGGVSGFIAPPV